MPNLTKAELEDMHIGLHEPGPNDREYGKRGKITANAIKEERIIAEAEVEMIAEGDTNVPTTY